MRMRHLLLSLFLVLSFALFCLSPKGAAQTGCPGVTWDELGWGSGLTLNYTTEGLTPELATAAEEAVRRVNAKNAQNNSYVTFQPRQGSDTADLRFLQNTTIGSVAGWADISREPSGALQTAQVYINTSKTINDLNGNPVLAFNPNEANYFEALVGVFVHEIGHTMGLDDVNIPDPLNVIGCGGQTRGASVMNAFCGVNNQGWDYQGGSMASSFTNCDQSTLTSFYAPVGGGEDWVPQYPGQWEQCYDVWVVVITYSWMQGGWQETGRYYSEYLGIYCEPRCD